MHGECRPFWGTAFVIIFPTVLQNIAQHATRQIRTHQRDDACAWAARDAAPLPGDGRLLLVCHQRRCFALERLPSQPLPWVLQPAGLLRLPCRCRGLAGYDTRGDGEAKFQIFTDQWKEWLKPYGEEQFSVNFKNFDIVGAAKGKQDGNKRFKFHVLRIGNKEEGPNHKSIAHQVKDADGPPDIELLSSRQRNFTRDVRHIVVDEIVDNCLYFNTATQLLESTIRGDVDDDDDDGKTQDDAAASSPGTSVPKKRMRKEDNSTDATPSKKRARGSDADLEEIIKSFERGSLVRRRLPR